jgi:hypothetical protein
MLWQTCCSSLLQKFFSFRAQEDLVIATILTKSSNTKLISGLYKSPRMPREQICKGREVGGGYNRPIEL